MIRQLVLGLFLVLVLVGVAPGEPEREVIHIIVRVAARDIGKRIKDEMPAEFRLTSADIPPNRRLDPASLQMVR